MLSPPIRGVKRALIEPLMKWATAHGRFGAAGNRDSLRRKPVDGSRFDQLANEMQARLAGRRHTPSELILRKMRDER